MSPENATYVGGFSVPSQMLVRSRLVFAVLPHTGKSRQIVVNMEESLARSESALDEVVSYNEFTESPIDVLAESLTEMVGHKAMIGLELDYIPHEAYEALTARLPNMTIEDAGPLFSEARMIKMPSEIHALRTIGRAAHEMHYKVLEATKVGDTELDIASRIIDGLLKGGADHVLKLVVGSGDRSWHANAAATSRRIEEGEMIRLDIFGSKDAYLSDVARTGIAGEASAEQKNIWDKFIDLRQQALEMIKPGASTRQIYMTYARDLEDFGYTPINFLGHGLGLTLHEEPYIDRYSDSKLEAGMVLAIEPYLMLPDRNWGFQLEDEVVVTDDGYELITDLYDDRELISVGA
jgi:Xaa-Pro aminopeptidase